MAKADSNKSLGIPMSLLRPIRDFLEAEVKKLRRTEKYVKKNDPFRDGSRGLRNSDEEDVDEQVGHFEAEVKANFIRKRLVQLRKALTNLKIGRYGVCESCGKMIDTDRLAVKPDATLCIDCRKDRE